jgi:hypothetical protein
MQNYKQFRAEMSQKLNIYHITVYHVSKRSHK